MVRRGRQTMLRGLTSPSDQFSFSTALTTNSLTLLSVDKGQAVLQSTPKLHKSSNFNFKCFKQIAMQSKTLLLALSVAALSSCSTAYKTGQTPDDVYYSPARIVEEKQNDDKDQDKVRNEPANDYEITMGIRDRRWRDLRDDYEYRNSPYNYVTCKTYNYGYYYNPYYYPWAIYTGKITYSAPVNTTPRMVNLNAYNGYNSKVASGKTSGTVTWSNPSTQYNNSNRSSTRSEGRQIILPRINPSPSNDTRTYTPSSSNSSSNGSSSSGSSGSGSVSRPGRGG